ncbi:hypothetical protein CTI14_05630 [Methylobacterium radiotolerans]|nr:hypothetical protein CTI14_05630 [Methylobacterium radiotolerans]
MVRIDFEDDLVCAFCEQRTGIVFPWPSTLRRPLMTRIQSLDAAVDERDILALSSLDYAPDSATRGTIRVDTTYRLGIELLPGPPAAVSIRGLAPAPSTGDRNV